MDETNLARWQQAGTNRMPGHRVAGAWARFSLGAVRPERVANDV